MPDWPVAVAVVMVVAEPADGLAGVVTTTLNPTTSEKVVEPVSGVPVVESVAVIVIL